MQFVWKRWQVKLNELLLVFYVFLNTMLRESMCCPLHFLCKLNSFLPMLSFCSHILLPSFVADYVRSIHSNFGTRTVMGLSYCIRRSCKHATSVGQMVVHQVAFQASLACRAHLTKSDLVRIVFLKKHELARCHIQLELFKLGSFDIWNAPEISTTHPVLWHKK